MFIYKTQNSYIHTYIQNKFRHSFIQIQLHTFCIYYICTYMILITHTFSFYTVNIHTYIQAYCLGSRVRGGWMQNLVDNTRKWSVNDASTVSRRGYRIFSWWGTTDFISSQPQMSSRSGVRDPSWAPTLHCYFLTNKR